LSRIERERITPGTSLTAADLNARYNDYVQVGVINEENTRDGAVDVPHLPADATVLNTAHEAINANDIYHTAFSTVGMTLAGAPTPTEVGRLNLSASPWSVGPNSILRIYGSLQCKGFIENDPNNVTPIHDGMFTIQNYPAATAVNLSLGAHVWIVQLQWDITSAGLTNWVPVPGGSDFQSQFKPNLYGTDVATLQGCAMTQAYWSGAEDWRPGARAAGTTNTTFRGTGWKNVPVTFSHFNPASTYTLYGLRLVVHGVYHPAHTGSTNGLVLDYNFGAWGNARTNPPAFNYSNGSLSAIQMRRY